MDPETADRHHLHRETQPVVIAATRRDQPPILVVQIAEPLQIHPRQHAETPVTGHTLINHADIKSPPQQPDSACPLSVTFLPDTPQAPTTSRSLGGSRTANNWSSSTSTI